MEFAFKISNEQSLKSGIKELVVGALESNGIAHLKNCFINDSDMNRVDFEIKVTVKKVTDSQGNEANFSDQAISDKRHKFAKDLDKLTSGDYVLAPKEPPSLFIQRAWKLPVLKPSLKSDALERRAIKLYQAMIEILQEQA